MTIVRDISIPSDAAPAACGAADKPTEEKKPGACGAACGFGDK